MFIILILPFLTYLNPQIIFIENSYEGIIKDGSQTNPFSSLDEAFTNNNNSSNNNFLLVSNTFLYLLNTSLHINETVKILGSSLNNEENKVRFTNIGNFVILSKIKTILNFYIE